MDILSVALKIEKCISHKGENMKNTNIFNETDYQLILRAQHYDNFAIELLCKRYENLIFKYAHMQHLHAVAADVESELWLAFIKAIYTYNVDSQVPPAGYFNSSVKYAQWNIFKKYRRQWEREHVDNEEICLNLLEADYNLEDSVLDDLTHKDTLTQLQKEIVHLPNRDKQLLYWHYVEKLSFTKIAQKLTISKQRVSYLHQQLIKKLSKIL